jgi:RND family efflux transporter MFP subunit
MRLLLILSSLLFLLSCGDGSEETSDPIRPVKYEVVKRSTGMVKYTFSGVAKPENETNLSFKVAGTLASVNVKLGDRVTKGQLIATLDPSDYNIQTNQALSQKDGAVANAKAAEAQLMSAKATYNRIAQLYESNSVALSEYQQAKAALDAAQAQYDAANSQISTSNQQLAAAGNQVSYTRLTSPMNGVITALQVQKNEVVNAGMLIANVSSLGRPEVEVGVPEALINELNIGEKATVTFSSLSNQVFDAEVIEIAFASERSTTFPIKLKIITLEDEIRPGMAAEVSFTLGTADETTGEQLVAPLKAVASGPDGNYVFKLIPDTDEGVYKAQRVAVELGPIIDNGYVIKSGITDGDLVATAGLRSLYDGKKVKLLED